MAPLFNRRSFLASAVAALTGLSGCSSDRLPGVPRGGGPQGGSGPMDGPRGDGSPMGEPQARGPLGGTGTAGTPDRTLYVGSYHWGFVMVDETGTEVRRVTLDPGTTVRLVALNTGATAAMQQLPETVRAAIPGHHELEERNEGRVPSPTGGDLHDALEQANEQYPDHSFAVMPSGWNHMRPGSGPSGMHGTPGTYGEPGGAWGGQSGSGGMMLPPAELAHDATSPRVALLTATQSGDYTFSCLTYCGYGHPYMDLDGALRVR